MSGSREAATCGGPGCTARAVYASSTADRTVVLCRHHRDRVVDLEAEAEAETTEEPAPSAAAAGGARW